jgi:membrane-bound lytic murein transglycosylase A
LQGNRVVPYFSRAEITAGAQPLTGQELLWVDDAVALFMLQVQGSGRVQMPDGSMLAVGYADQNGHPYYPIGRRLVEMGALIAGEVTLFSIRDWLQQHPDEAQDVLNRNPSYIFFALRDASLPGPLGSLNVPLVAQRSIAVDAAKIPLGLPVWLDTTLPGGAVPYRRLMQAQDTGGAIKGQVRADIFFGRGVEAERLAGEMKQPGRMYVLLPQASPVVAAQ